MGGDGWSYATLPYASSGYTARVDRGITSVEPCNQIINIQMHTQVKIIYAPYGVRNMEMSRFTAFVPYSALEVTKY